MWAAIPPPSNAPRGCRRRAWRPHCAGAQTLVDLGVTLLTVGVNGPDYDLSIAEALVKWRDDRAAG